VLEFRILGPLEVRRDGCPIKLGAAKQRALLAILLLNANRVVSRDRLADGLWGDQLPATASTALRVYVSELRKALDPERPEDDPPRVIVTTEPGYRMEVQPDQLDLFRFERLTEAGGRSLGAGDPSAASAAFREALELWRGPALDDFTYESFAQSAISRLEELRLVALERRIEADLALGRHVEVVPELEGLLAEHPLRERLRGHAMLALYRSGRQGDALAAYQNGRRALADELGIDPSQPLQQLEQAILRQDPALDLGAHPAKPAAAPVGGPPVAAESYPERSVLVAPLTDGALDALIALAAPMAVRPAREVIVARLVSDPGELDSATVAVQAKCDALIAGAVAARAAAFTSSERGKDIARLATEQDVDLLLVDASTELLETGELDGEIDAVLSQAPCDVVLAVLRAAAVPEGPILVPVGGGENEWAAVEIGAWIASALSAPLVLVGTAGDEEAGRRDASRLLAHASLAIQRGLDVKSRPLLVPPGDAALVEASAEARLLVVGLSDRWRQEGLGSTRLAVARHAHAPTLLVRRGLRPGGLAPQESYTRFTWSLTS
jgi:DNA-binding SARP family transcriptional activator